MGRTCTICRSPRRAEIEEATFTGEPIRSIAGRTGTSPASILRHREAHIPRALVAARRVQDVTAARSLAEKVSALEADALRIARRAEEEGDLRAALVGVRQLAEIAELLSKAAQAETAVNLPEGLDPRIVRLLLGLTPDEQVRFAETGVLPLAARKETASWLDIQTK